MDLLRLHEILTENRMLIAETWNFFVTVHLALIGLVIIAPKQKVPHLILWPLICAYLSFCFINFRAQQDNYQYVADLLALTKTAEIDQLGRESLSAVFSAGWISSLLPLIYAAAAILGVVGLIWGARVRATHHG